MEVEIIFLIIASIIGIGFASNYTFKRTKIPDVLFLMLLGIVLGPLTGILSQEMFVDAIPFVSAIALMIILFDGGLGFDIYRVIKEVPRAVLLAILSFSFSAISIAILSYYALNLGVMQAVLLGSILGGVSSPIVIPIVSSLEDFGTEPEMLLDIESVITDPLCIVVAIVLMDVITGTSAGGLTSAFSPVLNRAVSFFSVSIVIGLVFGILWLVFLRHIKGERYHYMLTLSYLFLVYSATEFLGGSGAISSFMVGIVLGNGKNIGKMFRMEKKYFGLTEKTKRFHEQISFFVKSFFFVILGVTITFKNPLLFLFGLIITLVIVFTRYLVVEIVSYRTSFSRTEKSIMTFMAPRGLAAAVLASMPIAQYNIVGTETFPEISFSVILGTAIVSTIGVFVIEHRKDESDRIDPDDIGRTLRS